MWLGLGDRVADGFAGLSRLWPAARSRLPPPLPLSEFHRSAVDLTPECGLEPVQRTPKKLNRTPDMSREFIIEELSLGTDPLIEVGVEEHARRLLQFLLHRERENLAPDLDAPSISRGRAVRGLFSHEAEQTYLWMCAFVLWWKPHRWEGTGGVAQYLRRRLKHKRGTKLPYAYTVIDGVEHRLAFLPIPASAILWALRPADLGRKRTPKALDRTPNRTPKLKMVRTKRVLGSPPVRRAA